MDTDHVLESNHTEDELGTLPPPFPPGPSRAATGRKRTTKTKPAKAPKEVKPPKEKEVKPKAKPKSARGGFFDIALGGGVGAIGAMPMVTSNQTSPTTTLSPKSGSGTASSLSAALEREQERYRLREVEASTIGHTRTHSQSGTLSHGNTSSLSLSRSRSISLTMELSRARARPSLDIPSSDSIHARHDVPEHTPISDTAPALPRHRPITALAMPELRGRGTSVYSRESGTGLALHGCDEEIDDSHYDNDEHQYDHCDVELRSIHTTKDDDDTFEFRAPLTTSSWTPISRADKAKAAAARLTGRHGAWPSVPAARTDQLHVTYRDGLGVKTPPSLLSTEPESRNPSLLWRRRAGRINSPSQPTPDFDGPMVVIPAEDETDGKLQTPEEVPLEPRLQKSPSRSPAPPSPPKAREVHGASGPSTNRRPSREDGVPATKRSSPGKHASTETNDDLLEFMSRLASNDEVWSALVAAREDAAKGTRHPAPKRKQSLPDVRAPEPYDQLPPLPRAQYRKGSVKTRRYPPSPSGLPTPPSAFQPSPSQLFAPLPNGQTSPGSRDAHLSTRTTKPFANLPPLPPIPTTGLPPLPPLPSRPQTPRSASSRPRTPVGPLPALPSPIPPVPVRALPVVGNRPMNYSPTMPESPDLLEDDVEYTVKMLQEIAELHAWRAGVSVAPDVPVDVLSSRASSIRRVSEPVTGDTERWDIPVGRRPSEPIRERPLSDVSPTLPSIDQALNDISPTLPYSPRIPDFDLSFLGSGNESGLALSLTALQVEPKIYISDLPENPTVQIARDDDLESEDGVLGHDAAKSPSVASTVTCDELNTPAVELSVDFSTQQHHVRPESPTLGSPLMVREPSPSFLSPMQIAAIEVGRSSASTSESSTPTTSATPDTERTTARGVDFTKSNAPRAQSLPRVAPPTRPNNLRAPSAPLPALPKGAPLRPARSESRIQRSHSFGRGLSDKHRSPSSAIVPLASMPTTPTRPHQRQAPQSALPAPPVPEHKQRRYSGSNHSSTASGDPALDEFMSVFRNIKYREHLNMKDAGKRTERAAGFRGPANPQWI